MLRFPFQQPAAGLRLVQAARHIQPILRKPRIQPIGNRFQLCQLILPDQQLQKGTDSAFQVAFQLPGLLRRGFPAEIGLHRQGQSNLLPGRCTELLKHRVRF